LIDIKIFFVWMLLSLYALFYSQGGIDYLRQHHSDNPIVRWMFKIEAWLTQIIFSVVIHFLLFIRVLKKDADENQSC